MTNPVIKITVKDYGTMTAELYPAKAPKTVANFLKLIEEGFPLQLIDIRSALLVFGSGQA